MPIKKCMLFSVPTDRPLYLFVRATPNLGTSHVPNHVLCLCPAFVTRAIPPSTSAAGTAAFPHYPCKITSPGPTSSRSRPSPLSLSLSPLPGLTVSFFFCPSLLVGDITYTSHLISDPRCVNLVSVPSRLLVRGLLDWTLRDPGSSVILMGGCRGGRTQTKREIRSRFFFLVPYPNYLYIRHTHAHAGMYSQSHLLRNHAVIILVPLVT